MAKARQCRYSARAMPAEPSVAIVLPPREGFGPGRTGGVSQVARLHAAIAGFRTTVIGGVQAGLPFGDVPFMEARLPFWRPGNINARYAAGVAPLLRRLRPDLIEVHNRPEVALALARRLPEARIGLFLHNDPQSMRAARTPAERAALLRRMGLVVTVSDYLRGRLLDGVGEPARAPATLPNCIDLAGFPPQGERGREVLFVGRVVPEKAPDAFVAACARALPALPGWRATIIGADRFRADSPDTGFIRGVRAEAEQAGVTMSGYRDHPETLAAMTRAAIVVIPSRWQEPFGLVALEAMASGAAVICSRRGALPEVAGDAAVYADPEDVGGLAEAIVALARDPARRAALGEAGRARAATFDAGRVTRRLVELRDELLGRPRSLYSS